MHIGSSSTPLLPYTFSGFANAKTSLLVDATGASEFNPEFAAAFQLIGRGGTSDVTKRFKIAVPIVFQSLPGSGSGWAINAVASSDAALSPRTGLQVFEANLNNNHFNADGNPSNPYVAGLYVTGSGAKPAHAGLIIAGSGPIWRDGIHFEDRSPKDSTMITNATINDRSKSPMILRSDTSHVAGVDFTEATFSSGYAILLGSAQMISWRDSAGLRDIPMIKKNVKDQLVLGADSSGVVISGPVTLTSKLNIVGSVIEVMGLTPADSSSPCTTGQHAWDINYEYRCVATNTWKRSALTNW